MTNRIPQSTAFLVVFKAYLASDHVTEATSKTIAITISKNGGAFGNPNAGATNATEISSGWYKVSLDTTDTGTVGPLAIRGAVATIDDVGVLVEVVKATNGGYTALPDTACTTNASLITSGTSTAQLSVSSGLVTLAAVTHSGAVIPTVTTVTNQLSAAAIATGVWTDTVAGDFTTALSVGKSVMNGVTLGTGLTVNDITTKSGYSLSATQTFNVTGNITGNLTGSVGSVSGAVGSVTGLTASNLDATISSRMATYTQPTGFLAATFPGTVASTTNITSITGNITGNLSGSVGSVTAGVTVTTNNDKTGYTASTVSDKTGYALTAAYDAAKTASTQTSVDDLPTNAELATALASADDATLAAIAALPTTSTVMNADIKKVNGVTVVGDGSGTPWGP